MIPNEKEIKTSAYVDAYDLTCSYRSSLMTGGAKRGVPNPWLFEEPEETRGLGFDEIRQQQQKIIQEQDAGLDALSSIISRQKQMGKEIGNELDEQNEIIDDLANLVENTDGKLRTETRRVNMVDRKSTSCGPDVLAALFLALVTFMWPLKIIMTKSVYRDRKMHVSGILIVFIESVACIFWFWCLNTANIPLPAPSCQRSKEK
ncbi:syntaxin-8 isoform X6 [Ursus arctos]|uniref:syntaxin-8 isoform X6 n=1 Tax=Ursus arctos TaxID=9644 RepID=UPI001CF83624|nr:syntaxin-8 isoform X6 [Ursus arctos]